jgi:hypothetical protein
MTFKSHCNGLESYVVGSPDKYINKTRKINKWVLFRELSVNIIC